MDLSIIIPLFNERDNLAPLHAELEGVLGALGRSYEIVFIDDGSDDGGEKVLREIKGRDAHVRAIRGRPRRWRADFRAPQAT
jgi:glycosyltransferase involved in cell wall biosynthesis